MTPTSTASDLLARALACASRGDVGGVRAAARAAAAVDPTWLMTAVRMAEVALQMSGPGTARVWLGRGSALDPGEDPLAHVLARTLRAEAVIAKRQGALTLAGVSLRQAATLAPDDGDTLFELAVAMAMSPHAADFLRRSLAVRRWFGALINLGNLDKAGNRITSAIGRYRQALADQPASAIGWNNIATCLRDRADVPEAVAGYRRALAVEAVAATESNLLQCLQFDQSVGDHEIAAAHRRWAARYASDRAIAGRSFVNERNPDRRLVVGYVSADFGRHPVGFFLAPVLQRHDRRQVQVVCYETRRLGDEVTTVLRSSADLWRTVEGLDDDALAAAIAADRVDILVDLSGHTAHHRLLTFARRPAPIQVSWLGYFDTCGLPQIDYLLTDAWEVPSGHRSRFVEEVVALPTGRFAYRPPAYAPVPMRRPGPFPMVFGSFNNLGKMTDRTVGLWSRVLAECPGSSLLLKWASLADDGVAAAIRRRFARHGIGGDRLILRGASGHDRMLAEYGDVDVALDPLPFSGCLTTVEALWMGVPVVTLPGGRPVSRQSAAILWRLGLDELVATTDDHYVSIAASLAADAERRQRLRSTIRDQMRRSTLLDGGAVAASIEVAYRGMWRRWCAATADGSYLSASETRFS